MNNKLPPLAGQCSGSILVSFIFFLFHLIKERENKRERTVQKVTSFQLTLTNFIYTFTLVLKLPYEKK